VTGIPYSVTVHAHDIFEDKPMLCEKLENARFIIAISKYNREYLLKNVDEGLEKKIRVVHCGIRPEKYRPLRSDTRKDQRLEIVHIGSLEPYKGQKYLVEACRLLKAKQIPVHLSIVGTGYEKQTLEVLISRYGLVSEVTLAGPKTQEEIAALLPTAHCYVQPSIITSRGTMEGIPVALMEAMACGIPVIATAISGIPELIENGRNGLLVPPEDPAALAVAIESIITDYTAALKMGLRGREKVLAEFDLHKNVKELDAIISSIWDDKNLNMPASANQP
jgi:glycosyltransferase involved in cell wall biosynthesis